MPDGNRRTGWIAWLTAFVVLPPAVTGALGHQFVASHPAWAILIAVAYEALVAVGGIFTGVARDVSARWQVRIADQVDLFLQRKAVRFERRYRGFVLERLRFMDHKGLPTVGPSTPELDEVFVNLSLARRPPQQIRPGVLPALADEDTVRRVLSDFIGQEKPARLAVVGSPGSGKTTLLRHAARQACLYKRSWRNRGTHVRDVPVLLYLRDHAATIIGDPDVSLAALLRKTLGDVGVDEPPEWLEHRLRTGRCLVLLDGLDEVARREDRTRVSAWAEGQISQYPDNDFVISSRPQGYKDAPVEGADILEVCGFTPSQVEAFVRGWYQAVERRSVGTEGPAADAHAARGAEDLLERLDNTPALYDLTVNPLLLTMIANVHRYRGALPGSRAELYSEICEAMLWRRQAGKKLAQDIPGDKKETILRGLAHTMMRRRVSDLSHEDVIEEIRPVLRRMSRGAIPVEFLEDVSANGLIIERETGQFAFAHKTFQEYLTAAHIRDRSLVSELADAVNDDWWAETTLLYAAKSNADPIIAACLDSGTATALALALDCTTGQDSEIDPDLRERLEDLVASAADADADADRRRLFAGILLSKHMRQREHTTGGIQVCARPIPSEIYRLFLADTQVPEPDASQAEQGIATGMRSSDARAFVQWASTLSGELRAYRLPLGVELTELAAQQHIPALPSGQLPIPWAHADKTSPAAIPVLWLPPGTTDPYELSGALLAEAARDDIAHSPYTLSGALLLRSRILTRVLVLVGALNRDLNRALNLDSILDHVRDHVRDSDPDAEYGRDLDRVLGGVLDHARDFDLGRVLDGSRDLGLDRIRDLVRGFDPDRIRDLVSDFSLDQVRDHDVDLVLHQSPRRVGDVALAVALAMDGELDETVGRNLPLSDIYAGIRSIFGVACQMAMGRTFSGAVTELPLGIRWGAFTLRAATEFARAAGVDAAGHFTADPATLATTLQDAVRKLGDPADGERSGLLAGSPWPAALAGQLSRDAKPVFDRADRPTPERVTAIRMAALRLAAEADAAERRDIGDLFRHVAAGITLLRQRATTVQASEVIMLAMDQSA